jgi:hypothetical protein
MPCLACVVAIHTATSMTHLVGCGYWAVGIAPSFVYISLCINVSEPLFFNKISLKPFNIIHLLFKTIKHYKTLQNIKQF